MSETDLVKFESDMRGRFIKLAEPAIANDVRCAALPDGRRGIWFVVNASQILILAGREGDDASFAINVGDTFTAEHFWMLRDCLAEGLNAMNIAAENKNSQ